MRISTGLWAAVAGLPLVMLCPALLGQAPQIAPVHGDPLELAAGPIQAPESIGARNAALQLLARARSSYAIRGNQGYDLKVSFTVDSGGETEFDGAWQMEEMYVPGQGVRWTAQSSSGFSTVQIRAGKVAWAEGTSLLIPLRLHEARAALFGPIASAQFAAQDRIRTSSAVYNGVPVTCVLLSGRSSPAQAASGRGWQESEECIDPHTGLLQIHSLAPGSYAAYDYSNAVFLGERELPGKVTVREGGRVVMQLQVQSLVALPSADPALFAPSEQMKANPAAVLLGEARRVTIFPNADAIAPGSTISPVCVFGVITPGGQLAEAHSLQPADPNSAAAIRAAEQMNFQAPVLAGAQPAQHFGFIIVNFAAASSATNR